MLCNSFISALVWTFYDQHSTQRSHLCCYLYLFGWFHILLLKKSPQISSDILHNETKVLHNVVVPKGSQNPPKDFTSSLKIIDFSRIIIYTAIQKFGVS